MQKGPPFHILLFYRSLQNRTRLKGPLSIFFGIVRLFFKNFLMYQKSPPFEFFDILQQNICWWSPKGPPFYIFWHYATISERKNIQKFFEKFFLRFLSLRYSADFRRSRLVCFFFQPTISLWMVHFSYNLCSFVQLIFRKAGGRGFDSRTKPQIFYASKSRCETKGFLSFDFFRFFSALCDFFFGNFRILSKGNPLHFFEVFGL